MTIRRVLTCALLLQGAVAVPALAQGTGFSASLIVPGVPSPFISDWERNPQIATLSVTYSGTAAMSYTIAAEVTGAGRGVISKATSGPYDILAGPTTQLISSTQLNCFAAENVKAFVDQIIRTGMIPEDRYTLTVRVLSTGGAELARATQVFTISLPDPPRLIYPANKATITTAQPMFQWSPVAAATGIDVSYKVRVVEILAQQTAATAIASNRPLYEDAVKGATSLLYPVDALALAEGKRYAWRVEAVDSAGNPITSARRRSEMYEFMRPRTDSVGLPLSTQAPDTVVLEPGVAILTGMRNAVRRDEGGLAVYNGRARLELIGPVSGSGDVQIDNVAVRPDQVDGTPSNGYITGDLSTPIPLGRFGRLNRISYTPSSGISLSGELTLPGASPVPLSGQATLGSGGLTGTLRAPSNAIATLPLIRSDQVSLRLTDARIVLPELELSLIGSISMFDVSNVCMDIKLRADSTGALVANVTCGSKERAFIGGSAALLFNSVTGTLTADLGTGVLKPTLNVTGTFDPGATKCDGTIAMRVNADTAIATGFSPDCTNGVLDADWQKLDLSGLTMDSLSYAPGNGFNFSFHVNAQPRIATLGAFALPAFNGILIDRSGWSFGEVDVPASGDLIVQGYTLRTTQVRHAAFTRPWSATGASGFRYLLTSELVITPGPKAPSCIPSSFPIAAQIISGQIIADLTPITFARSCEPDGFNGQLHLTGLSGALFIALDDSLRIPGPPKLAGTLDLPTAFTCANGRAIGVGPGLVLRPDGGVSGRIDTLLPCALDLAPVSLSFGVVSIAVDSSSLRLSGTPNGSFAVGSPAVNGQGTLSVDLLTGKILTADASFAGPFPLGLPRTSPGMTISVNDARLDTTGVHVNGRGQLSLTGGSAVGAVFDSVTLSAAQGAISSGSITLETPFGLRAATGADGTLGWTAVSAGSPVGAATSFRADLPAGMKIDRNGMSYSGPSVGALAFGRLTADSLTATFRDSTVLSVAPFGVANGSIELERDGQRLAYVDALGFHADRIQSASNALPARIALPSEQVAYLNLAGADSSDIRADKLPDGRTQLRSAPGRTLPLVLPALADSGSNTVRAIVDVILDMTGSVVTSGTITAATNITLLPRGTPFLVDTMSFTGGAADTWTLSGRPFALGAFRGGAGGGTLTLDASGTIAGSIDLADASATTIIAGTRPLTFQASRIKGDFSTTPASSSGSYAIEAIGEFQLATEGTRSLRAPASIIADLSGVRAKLDPASAVPAPPVTIDAVVVALTNFRLPHLSFVNGIWNAEALVDASIGFSALPMLPAIDVTDAKLTPTGLVIPRLEAPELRSSPELIGDYQVRPLALRSNGGRIDWFGNGASGSLGVSFDLELSFPKATGVLKDAKLSVLDAKAQAGYFTGPIEPRTLPVPLDVPIASSGVTVRVTRLSGSLNQLPDIDVAGSVTIPQPAACPGTPTTLNIPAQALKLDATGGIAGNIPNLAQTCRYNWGPVTFYIPEPRLSIGGGAAAPYALLAGDARVSIGGTPWMTGDLRVDPVTLKPVYGSVDLGDIRWPLAGAGGDLGFRAPSGSFGPHGLTLDGPGALVTTSTVGTRTLSRVDFSALTYPLGSIEVASGSATIADTFNIGGVIAANGTVAWTGGVAWKGAGDEIQLTVASGAELKRGGMTVPAGTTGRVLYDGVDVAATITAIDNLLLSSTAHGVISGRAEFRRGQDAVGYLDQGGFKPGAVFAIPAMPARLPLSAGEAAGIAFIELMSNGSAIADLVRMPGETDRVHVRARPGITLNMVVPSLGANLRFPVTGTTDLAVNPRTFAPVSGSITAAIPTPIDVGPATFTTLTYSDDSTGGVKGFALRGTGRVDLPASLDSIRMPLTLGVTANGFEGQVSVANVAGAIGPLLRLDLYGNATIAATNSKVELYGNLRSPVIAMDASTPMVFKIRGLLTAAGLEISFRELAQSLPMYGSSLDMNFAQPQLPITVTATAQSFAITMSGTWRIPSLGNVFGIALKDFRIDQTGVSVGDTQAEHTFRLFGSDFKARLAPIGANGSRMDGSIVRMALEGEMTVLGNKAQFAGMLMGTDGRVTTFRPNLLSDSISIGGGKMRIASVVMDSGRLVATVNIDLPEPLSLKATTKVMIGRDGDIAQKRFILRNEEPGRTGGGKTLIGVGTVGGVQLHPRNVSLVIKSPDGAESGIEVVADAYLNGSSLYPITIGGDDGGEVEPGYTLGFNGKGAWANFGIADTVSMELGGLAKLTIDAVTAPKGEAFELGLTGSVSLDIAQIQNKSTGVSKTHTNTRRSVGLLFRDVYITRTGLDMSKMAIEGGSIALMDGALIIDISRINYSNTPTTITVASTDQKEGGMPAPAADKEITVSSVIDLGGSICVGEPGQTVMDKDCIMSGGVDRVLLYKAGGLTTFVIENANISMEDKFEMSLDFTYSQLAKGMSLAFAGSGTVKPSGRGMTVAGAAEINDGELRIGAFMAFNLQLQFGPITLDNAGGGFFWRPLPEHINLIRKAALGDLPDVQVRVDTAKFAIFLFGDGSIGTKTVANGAVLITASDEQLILDGKVELLSQGKKMEGVVQLAIGIKRGYVEGNIDVTAVQEGLIEAEGSIAFYYYGSETWGLVGVGTADLFPGALGLVKLTANADFFIGPKGFITSFGIEQSIDILSIITLSSGFKAQIWYHKPSSDWGAYASLYASASVLGVGVDGTLEGALITQGGDQTIYAAGNIGASVGVLGRVSVDAHVTIDKYGIDGGFGRDDAMDAALAQARKVKGEMETSKSQVTSAIERAKLAAGSVRLTSAQLAQVFSGMQAMARSPSINELSWLITFENIAFNAYSAPDFRNHLNWYQKVLRGEGSPAADTAAIVAARAKAEGLWKDVDAQRDQVAPKIAQLQLIIAEGVAAVRPPKPGNPVTNLSYKPPTVTYSVVGGDTVAKATGLPGFDVDPVKNAANEAAAAGTKVIDDAAAAKVLAAATSVDATLAQLKDVLVGQNAAASIGKMLGSYADARNASETMYANRMAHLGNNLIWTRAMATDLLKGEVVTDMQVSIASAFFGASLSGAGSPLVGMKAIDTRVGFISRLVQDPSINTNYLKVRPPVELASIGFVGPLSKEQKDFLTKEFRSTAMQLYFGVLRSGLISSDSSLKADIVATRSEMDTKLGALRTTHASLSEAVDDIYTQQGSLGGIASDLYSRYLEMKPNAANKATVKARLASLTKGLMGPSVANAKVTVLTTGLTSTIQFNWSGSHPVAIREFLYSDGTGLYSNGMNGSLTITRSYLEPATPVASTTKNISLFVRGGLGFRTSQGLPYTISWPASNNGTRPDFAMVAATPRVGGLETATTTAVSVPPKDTTKPGRPVVKFDYAGVNNANAWVQPTAAIRVTWSATDAESGVQEYFVGVGTTQGGDDITKWASLGGRTDRILDDIRVGGGKTIYVSVKAKNSAGLESEIGTSAALRIDATPPTMPALKFHASDWFVSYYGQAAEVLPCSSLRSTDDISQFVESGEVKKPAFDPATYFVSAPNATDAESGIMGYFWRADTVPITKYDDKDAWNVLDPTALSNGWPYMRGKGIDYYKKTVVTVAAVNYAGAAVLSSSPVFEIRDASQPPPRLFCAISTTGDSVRIRFGAENPDPESQIIGYQYRVVYASNERVHRDWPADGKVDFAPAKGATTVPANATFDIALNYGGYVHVDVRAVNREKLTGHLVRVKYLLIDASPPAAPQVIISTLSHAREEPIMSGAFYVGSRVIPPVINLNVSGGGNLASGDPTSGIRRFEYSVGTTRDGFDVVGWKNLNGSDWWFNGGADPNPYLRASVPIAAALKPGTTYWIRVRAINHVGLASYPLYFEHKTAALGAK